VATFFRKGLVSSENETFYNFTNFKMLFLAVVMDFILLA
jgi:hypothetical protein